MVPLHNPIAINPKHSEFQKHRRRILVHKYGILHSFNRRYNFLVDFNLFGKKIVINY